MVLEIKENLNQLLMTHL